YTMSWETRRGRGRYYTRSTRRNGRIERRYFAAGADAEDAAAGDAARRAERQARAQARREQEAWWSALARPLNHLCLLSAQVLHAALLAAGFHRHGGVWRKKRNVHENGKQTNGGPPS